MDELAPEYGYELSQKQERKVETVKDLMKARNFRRSTLTFDQAINGAKHIPGGTILDGFVS